jgi:hypothetical protein
VKNILFPSGDISMEALGLDILEERDPNKLLPESENYL